MKTSDNLNIIQAENVALKTKITELEALVKWYEEQFRLAKHRQYGMSSEKSEMPEQLGLFNEAESAADKKYAEPEFEEVAGHKRKKRVGKRDEIYKDLPTERVIHELPENERICPDCGGDIHACGHEVLRREIEIIPAQVKAKEHVQTVYSCRTCEQSAADNPLPMVKSNVPAPVISGSGVASPSLLSYIICNKYVLALPLYRQEQEFVLFEYKPTRSSSHPLKFLADYKGFLHVDGYSGYKKLEPQGVAIVECWAHVRRKFHDALKALEKSDRPNSPANIGYELCNRLFELERKYDDENLSSEQRHNRRLLESMPMALKFFDWAKTETAKPTTLAKSTYGKAVGYAVNQQKWLMNIYLDGRLAISNNLAETSIRPFTIGRNNWLSSYSAKGAQSSAIAYSLVETAKANGLVPFLYFKYLFENLPTINTDQYRNFLPWLPTVQEICKKPK